MTTLHVDNDLAAILELESELIDEVARELIVLELYRRGTISGGKAEMFLGMERYAFMKRAAGLGIPYFQIPPEEMSAEFESFQFAAR